jgi:hypothetical protein
MDGEMQGYGFWSDFRRWAAHPFSKDMDLMHYGLLIGATIVIVIFWNILLRHIFEAVNGD